MSVSMWLAQDPPKPPQGPEFGASSPVGLVVILLMAVALVFLIRSMNKHLRKVPKTFNGEDETPEPTAGEPTEDKPNAAKNGAGGKDDSGS
ncbi:hypothetical protein [Pseudonocardia acaciae]|uniref:hypothetical protein n=1 Tax=Pseudonocardia acaciae TaxID=551276 RepID=UPI00048DEA10|nr:hypothetical protein [Pseudonocardia acaciae]